MEEKFHCSKVDFRVNSPWKKVGPFSTIFFLPVRASSVARLFHCAPLLRYRLFITLFLASRCHRNQSISSSFHRQILHFDRLSTTNSRSVSPRMTVALLLCGFLFFARQGTHSPLLPHTASFPHLLLEQEFFFFWPPRQQSGGSIISCPRKQRHRSSLQKQSLIALGPVTCSSAFFFFICF
ncbi:uncharacterized protein LOC116255534 [Nymphaea colorata]|nr:uncharacterized protein LOC116255534 [Nymphaea colorata]